MRQPISRRAFFAPGAAAAAAPAPLPPTTAAAHLANRATFGCKPAVVAQINAMGAAAWVDMQLEPDSIDDTALESQLLTLIARTATNAADVRMAARAVFSQRQLAWRMVYFLNNHFATYRPKTQPISETNEDDTFRRLCFGRFADVLRASAQSPAMIDFLDSQTNVSSSPNENYARELMELHTLGVGVYTEADVAAISRVFTGWSRVNTFSGTTAIGSKFDFRPTVHTQGPKTTSLGWSTPGFAGAAGVNEGLSFLEFLAGHVETARRFVRKLCVYFVSDQPSAALVGRALRKFRDTDGDLKATVRSILLDPDFATTATARGKAMDGFEFAVSSVRRLHLTTMTTYTTLLTRVGILRALPHSTLEPTGYPEISEEWQGPGNELARWDFASDLVNDLVSGVVVPWDRLIAKNPPLTAIEYVQPLCDLLCDGDVPPATQLALEQFMAARLATVGTSPTWTTVRPHARALAGLVLRLPEAALH
jgi:uncharacterized protein (DUF1800 family)